MALERFSKPSTARPSEDRDGIVSGKFRNAKVDELVETKCKRTSSATVRSENSDSSCKEGAWWALRGACSLILNQGVQQGTVKYE
jgi:hypothetical protein